MSFYETVMRTGAHICGQHPWHSPHVFGVQLPLCYRCLGIYAFLAIGAFLFWKGRSLSSNVLLAAFAFLAVACAALAFDVYLFQDYFPNNPSRFLAGAAMGLALSNLIVKSFKTLRD